MDSGTPYCRCCSGSALRTANGESRGNLSALHPDVLESISASFPRLNLCRFLRASGPVPHSGWYREYRKPVPQGTAPPRPIGAIVSMSEKPTGKATGRASPSRGRRKVCCWNGSHRKSSMARTTTLSKPSSDS